MKVRTISQLPPLTIDELKGSDESLIGVSQHEGDNSYTSKKITFKDFRTATTENLSAQIVKDYDMNLSSGSRVSLSGLSSYAYDIVNKPGYFVGPKEFQKGMPWVNKDVSEIEAERNKAKTQDIYNNNPDNIIPNIGYVKDMIINEQNLYISTRDTKIITGSNTSPLVNGSETQPSYTAYENSNGHLYFWKIDHNQKDSSTMLYDGMSWARQGEVEIKDSGNLVIWGWLADQGDIDPEYAWVGLFGRLGFSSTTSFSKDDPNSNQTKLPWFPIQIKPWIRGEYANTMQYVGFNVLVKKGLRLKIKTGFPVNGTAGGAKNSPGSLVFGDKDPCPPNSFFGYVIA